MKFMVRCLGLATNHSPSRLHSERFNCLGFCPSQSGWQGSIGPLSIGIIGAMIRLSTCQPEQWRCGCLEQVNVWACP
jgi:hypothetical protein